MLKLQLLRSDENLIKKATEYFTSKYQKDLKLLKPNTYNESLISRYLVSSLAKKELGIEDYIPELDFDNEEFEDFVYSISHKDNYVFVGVGDDYFGLDIEKYKVRDESVFEYFTLGEIETLGGKSFENFYIGWTAKESLIKFLGLGIDDVYNIKIKRIKNELNTISDIKFDKVIILNYEDNLFKVFSGEIKEEGIYFAVASNF